MITTGWDDWAAAAEAAWPRLAAGGAAGGGRRPVDGGVARDLARPPAIRSWPASSASTRPIQPPPDEIVEHGARAWWTRARTAMPAIGSRHRRPRRDRESPTTSTPLVALLLRLWTALAELEPMLARRSGARCWSWPAAKDHVVDPASSDLLAASVSGPVERLDLERSYHVATLDYDGRAAAGPGRRLRARRLRPRRRRRRLASLRGSRRPAGRVHPQPVVGRHPPRHRCSSACTG